MPKKMYCRWFDKIGDNGVSVHYDLSPGLIFLQLALQQDSKTTRYFGCQE